MLDQADKIRKALLEGKNKQNEMSDTISKLTKECEEGKQIQIKMSEKISKQEKTISKMQKTQEGLEDMICLIRKEGKWAQHSRGNRAFGREFPT